MTAYSDDDIGGKMATFHSALTITCKQLSASYCTVSCCQCRVDCSIEFKKGTVFITHSDGSREGFRCLFISTISQKPPPDHQTGHRNVSPCVLET